MRVGRVRGIVLAGIAAVMSHLWSTVLMLAMGKYWVTVTAGIFAVAAIWEIARPRTARPLRREIQMVELEPEVADRPIERRWQWRV